MRRIPLLCLWLSLLVPFVSVAQSPVVYSPEDEELFAQHLEKIEKMPWSQWSQEEQITALGKLFLGTPYVAKTLEMDGPEKVVVNLRGLDCTTYIENVLALKSLGERSESLDIRQFATQLEQLRYRDGRLDGYSSRLHYFSDWIDDNEKKGKVKNLTASLGGIREKRDINFMGQHPQYYPQLSSEQEVNKIQKIEARLSDQEFCYLPTAAIPDIQNNIRSGDILALVTSLEGLDVTHTGFALWQNGQLHLMHASTSGAVIVSEKPLLEYLGGIKNNIGILVVRPLMIDSSEE